MKILICANLQLGALCDDNISVKAFRRWQSVRQEKLSILSDRALAQGMSYFVCLGSLFGQDGIAENLVDLVISVAGNHKELQYVYFLNSEEYNRVNYRNDIPDNLHILQVGSGDSVVYEAEDVNFSVEDWSISLKVASGGEFGFSVAEDGRYIIGGFAEGNYSIPDFEPLGYECSSGTYGCALIDLSDSSQAQFMEADVRMVNYKSLDLELEESMTTEDVVEGILSVLTDADRDSIIRINLSGRQSADRYISISEIEKKLQGKVLGAFVMDSSEIEVETDSLKNDITLKSEFVRMAMSSETIDTDDRKYIVACGCEVLSGKEVPAE